MRTWGEGRFDGGGFRSGAGISRDVVWSCDFCLSSELSDWESPALVTVPAPDHWIPLTGPANWFRLNHPPTWQAEDRQGTFALRPSDGDALIAFNTIWMERAKLGPLPGLAEIVSQFPQSRNVLRSPDDSLDNLEDCQTGEAVLSQDQTWWGRLWKGPEWRAWKMWAFRRDNLYIVVTLLHGGPRDQELESLTRLMLRSMELPETPADPPEVFAQRALNLARAKFPLLTTELVDNFQIQISSSRLNLANFYRAYVRQPESFEQILLPALTTAVQVQGWGERETTPPLDVVRDRLMPMLYPEELWQEKFQDILGEPWVAGLVVLYVVDEANAYWYVRKELIERWRITPSELHEIAIDNLRSYFERKPMEMAVAADQEGSPAMMMPGAADSYNTVRLLCHNFLSQLREFACGDLAVGVPNRDVFVAVSTKQPGMIQQVRRQVREDYQQTDHPLTDRLLLITADGVSELPAEGE